MNAVSQKDDGLRRDKKRLLSVDIFKGFTIAIMVFVNTVGQGENTPSWSKHAVNYGLTYVDLVASFFVFMMALNFKPSYQHRLESIGRAKTYLHFVKRYLIFIGLGLLITIDVNSTGIVLRWGTLQVLGVSGLILLPLIELKPYIRLIFAFIFMLIHQYLLQTFLGQIIYDDIEGGIFGSLGGGSMMILSSVLAEGLYNKKSELYLAIGGTICTIFGIISSFFWGISRFRISLPFILISIGIASVFFYGLYEIVEVWGKNNKYFQKENLLTILGKNALLMFLFHIVLIILDFNLFPLNSPFLLVFTLGIMNVIIIWLISVFLYREKVIVII